uniref:Uncharacterized protein n=1 Tax=viral metagenome TaxID=1070528 RepID=A0A6M3LEX1_9ZZZZ
MEYLPVLIPAGIIVIGAIVHIEVSIAILRTDVKWIKRYLNNPKG